MNGPLNCVTGYIGHIQALVVNEVKDRGLALFSVGGRRPRLPLNLCMSHNIVSSPPWQDNKDSPQALDAPTSLT